MCAQIDTVPALTGQALVLEGFREECWPFLGLVFSWSLDCHFFFISELTLSQVSHFIAILELPLHHTRPLASSTEYRSRDCTNQLVIFTDCLSLLFCRWSLLPRPRLRLPRRQILKFMLLPCQWVILPRHLRLLLLLHRKRPSVAVLGLKLVCFCLHLTS